MLHDCPRATLGTAVTKELRAPAIQAKSLWFRYTKSGVDILSGTDFTLHRGEIFSLFGANGSGKTTLIHALAGLNKPYRGKVEINGNSTVQKRIALLPQEPKAVFTKDTVAQELNGNEEMIRKFRLLSLSERHPYDLSGGEQQLCAIAKILLSNPDILILDEPTKGMDADAKERLGEILSDFKKDCKAALLVTHDLDFAAKFADRCGLLFHGTVTSTDTPRAFFSGNYFYTTAAARIARGVIKNAVTCQDVIQYCNEVGYEA